MRAMPDIGAGVLVTGIKQQLHGTPSVASAVYQPPRFSTKINPQGLNCYVRFLILETTMPRPPRADEAGGLYHALNRGNLRAEIFHKDADYAAFENILHEGLELHQIQLFSYQLMPNHDHLVLRPLIDGEMSRFMGWIGGTHTMRYHAHYHTSGYGHVYQQRYKSFPIQDDDHFFVVCR
jgi:putative transposase